MHWVSKAAAACHLVDYKSMNQVQLCQFWEITKGESVFCQADAFSGDAIQKQRNKCVNDGDFSSRNAQLPVIDMVSITGMLIVSAADRRMLSGRDNESQSVRLQMPVSTNLQYLQEMGETNFLLM